jgi:glutamyl-tRNA reductase
VIVVVGLSHKTAPIGVRERLAMRRDNLPEVLQRLLAQQGIGEAVVLSTCNRVEVYAAAPGRGASDEDLARTARAVTAVLTSMGGEAVSPHLHKTHGNEAVLHLFRVAASLDSLVIGEPQILGQLKDAIEVARETRSLGVTLGRAMHRAVRVGKRVRSETAIGEGQVSVSSVAIDLAREIFGDLTGHTALLVGAGEMAEAASKLLVRGGARLLVVNRSPERGNALANEVGGEYRGWTELERSLVDADIVISSTSSPRYVITTDLVKAARKARKGRSLFLIDIAVPRDVDPAVNKLDNIYLYDVDDLSKIVSESLESRAAEAARAEAIAQEEARGFEAWTLEQSLTPAIVGLRNRTHAVLEAELSRSLHGKLRHLSAADREALGMMIDAATNKLLHAPVTKLRALAGDARGADYLEVVRDLFDLAATAEMPDPNGAHHHPQLDSDHPSGKRRSGPPAGEEAEKAAPLRAAGSRNAE